MRRACFWCREHRPLVYMVSFVLCCVVMLKMSHHLFNPLDSESSPYYNFNSPSTWIWPSHNVIPSQSVGPYMIQQNFKCSAKDSTEVIPAHLPNLYQDFLRYRHCLYPTLLTPSPCENDLYLLLAIKSTAINLERRAAVRDTWGHAGLTNGRRVKLVFLMGRSQDKVHGKDIQPLVELESRRYGDILQWDFMDIFLNLTQKEIGFLSWFSRACSSSQFALKGDDDVFVNTGNMVEFLSLHTPENHLFVGYIHGPELPIRDRNSKYFVPVEIFPDEKLYPPFPSGGGYLMSRQTVLGLNVAAQTVKRFPLDDVFLGMCLEKIGVNLTHHKGFLTFGFKQGLNHFDHCLYREIMLVHKLSPVEMRIMWQLMQDAPSCGKFGKTL